MTKTQVDYWNYKENKRHNERTEEISAQELQETNRHNTMSELETRRHNKIGENQTDVQLAETNRHNTVYERETERSNRAREAENYRHNVMSEEIGIYSAEENVRHNVVTEGINQQLADVSEYNAEENYRHNAELEYIQKMQTGETIRHNLANEDITRIHYANQDYYSWANVAESYRHNTALEAIDQSRVYEQTRHNMVDEGIATFKAKETQSHNIQSEKLEAASIEQKHEAAILSNSNVGPIGGSFVGQIFNSLNNWGRANESWNDNGLREDENGNLVRY